jgi:DNA-binding NtrC family response regulator
MPLQLQVRLLRVLEDRNITRVGGEAPIAVNVRVIASSLQDLRKSVDEGIFREDLYYRLSVLRIHLPPLRERPEDIPFLAVHFMDRAFEKMGLDPPYPALSTATISLLEGPEWKGNVRELRNVMTRVATLLPASARQVIPMHVLPHLEAGPVRFGEARARDADGVLVPRGVTLDEAEEILIGEALRQTGGNRTKAAKMLGISIRTLRRKLNRP